MRPRQLEDFEGAWTFTREVVEAGGRVAQVSGRAVWQPEGAGLRYVETGEMHLPSHAAGHAPMRVERSYHWDADLGVFFADGRFFHHVPPEGGATAHWCEPDQYDGCYDFKDWPAFAVTWRVRGPRKAYLMTTIYRPEET
jgi:hypothetical protein